jgi:hypothetical protein
MSNLKKKPSDRPIAAYRPLMIAALVASGILQPLLPVLAAGTTAGNTISNTATATYTDDTGTTTFNATSNTVKITVAPVSGLTVKPTGITDKDAGAVEQGDTLEYNFDVKNVGNTNADIFIPKLPELNAAAKNFTATKVEYFDTTLATPAYVAVPASGIILGVGADVTVKVRVTGTVATAGVVAGDLISVTLGDAGPNDNSAATQNLVDVPLTDDTKEVRTAFSPLDPSGTTNPVDNKEASASQSIAFASQVKPQAFALLEKTVDKPNSSPGATTSGNDDTIAYNLKLSVLNTSPNGNLTPAALEGTPIKVGATAGTAVSTVKILVSDAIPAGTVLKSAPAAITGWTAVYSTDSVDTTIPVISTSTNPIPLPAAAWSTTAPATPAELAAVKRVGFIATAVSIAPGTVSPDFKFSVVTSGLPVNGGKVYNIAQAFGTTQGDATKTIVADESGDASPSNADNTGVPLAFDPAVDTGKADPVNQGIDTKGDNTGIGTKGEDTEATITGTIPPANDSILNGPNGQPTAVGPTDANDDFTNVSTPIGAGLSPTVNITTAQTGTFTNTVSIPANPSNSAIAAVTVEPISPAQAEAADGITPTGQYAGTAVIPTLTTVKLTDLTVGTTNLPVIYSFDGTKFNIVAAVAGTQGTPLNFGNLPVGATRNYKTEVTLPANSVTPLTAIAIPLVVFADDDPTNTAATPSRGFTGESTNNITLDRVYTGYMKLVKEARILSADKNTILQDWTVGDATGLLTRKAAPGQYIEYRISYKNISTAANGAGNTILNAKNFTLIEDGAAAVGSNTNNWASNTLHQKNTLASQGTVNYFTGVLNTGLIGTTDPADGDTVGTYQNIVPLVAPASQGTFQFRRVVQ